jgi:hypothetical protein
MLRRDLTGERPLAGDLELRELNVRFDLILNDVGDRFKPLVLVTLSTEDVTVQSELAFINYSGALMPDRPIGLDPEDPDTFENGFPVLIITQVPR